MKKAIYTHPASFQHDTGPSHPENIKRIQRLNEILDLGDLSEWDIIKNTQPSSKEQICRAHSPSYYDDIEDTAPEQDMVMVDIGDTIMSQESFNAALHAAGAVTQACDDVLSGKYKRAFCMNRPPGHHAEPEHAMGFCLFNNVFIGAMQARSEWELDKVAIVDFDVHHGNGTDTMARRQTGLFFASSHEYPLYPGTGLPENNIPGIIENHTLKSGDGSSQFRDLYSSSILPKLESFAPEIIFISAGFDGHELDDISHLKLQENDFEWVTEQIAQISDKTAQGRVISVLEGGYHLEALANSTLAHLRALGDI